MLFFEIDLLPKLPARERAKGWFYIFVFHYSSRVAFQPSFVRSSQSFPIIVYHPNSFRFSTPSLSRRILMLEYSFPYHSSCLSRPLFYIKCASPTRSLTAYFLSLALVFPPGAGDGRRWMGGNVHLLASFTPRCLPWVSSCYIYYYTYCVRIARGAILVFSSSIRPHIGFHLQISFKATHRHPQGPRT